MTWKLQQDFLLLFKCIVDIGAEVLRDFTKVKIKSTYQTDNFKLLLGKTKHCLFHQLIKQKPICCECPIIGCSIKKTGNMNKKIFDKFYMYDKTVRCVYPHHGANCKTFSHTCICRFVEQTLVLNDLDLSDLNCLLRCLSLMSPSEEKLLKELMDIRGNICHAVDTKTFSQPELTNLWTTFMNAVCNLYPSDPKFLKMSVDLTKSSVLSDEKVLDLMEKVQQIITDYNQNKSVIEACQEIKPEIMECKEKIDTLQNQQTDNNTRLKRIESFLMGNIKTKDNQTQTNISLYDSDKTFITDGTSSEKQGVRYIDCVANCPDLDEDKAIKRLSTETDVNCSKKLKIESVEKHCLLLRLSSIPELFESKEILYSAIMSLIQKITEAGDVDTSVDSNMDIKITFTSPLTYDERHTVISMLGAYGSINEGYTTETTDRDEGIGDINSNEMDYSDNNRHDDMLFPKEEYMSKLENPFEAIKKEDMRNMSMDLSDNFLKKEANVTNSLDFQKETVKREATGKQYECMNKQENPFHTIKKEDIRNMAMNLPDNYLNKDGNETKLLDSQSGTVKMELTARQDEEIFLRIGNMKCLWKIKGLPNRLQHLDNSQDFSIEEGKQIWYLQWRLECPQDWDISSVLEKLNTHKRRLFFGLDFVHSASQREIVVETNTKKDVFNSYSTAEMAFKTFIGEIVKLCNLDMTESFCMSVTTSVLAVVEQEEGGMDSKNSREDNDIVCKHCKQVTNCYKCTEKLELVMELTSLLRTNDELIERLAQSMKMTKEEMIHGLDKHDNRMASGKDTTNEEVHPVKLFSSSDKELIEIEETSQEYDGKTKSPELHNEPRYGNVFMTFKDAYIHTSLMEQVQQQNKEAIDSSSKAPISTSPNYFHHEFATLPPSRHIYQYSSQVDQPTFHDFLQNHHQYQSGIKRTLSSSSSTHATCGSPLQDIGLLEDSDSHFSGFPEYAVKPMAYQQSNLQHLQQLQQTRNPSFRIDPLTSFQRVTKSPSPLGLGVGTASDTYSKGFASPTLQPMVNLPYEQEFGSDVRATFLDRRHPNGNMSDVTIHEDQFKDSSIDADTVKPSDRQGYDGRLNYVQKKSNNICDFCGKGYTTTSYLNKHVQTIHFGDRPYKCVFCFKGCSSSSNLKTHMRIHTGERPFQCAFCFRCFNTSSSLKMHMQKH